MDTNAANRCERAAPNVRRYQGAHVMSSRQNDRQTCTNISQHQQRGAKNPVGDIGGGQIDQWQENARAPRSPPYKECHLATTIDKKAVRFQGRSFGQRRSARCESQPTTTDDPLPRSGGRRRRDVAHSGNICLRAQLWHENKSGCSGTNEGSAAPSLRCLLKTRSVRCARCRIDAEKHLTGSSINDVHTDEGGFLTRRRKGGCVNLVQ